MGFYLYKYQKVFDTRLSFTKPETIELSNKDGPIGSFVLSKITDSTEAPFKWHMSAEEILNRLSRSKSAPDNYAIIIDLKPRKASVELYLLRDIWGYSDDSWTPLAIRLEELPTNHERAKDGSPGDFTISERNEIPVIEFLYLRAGIRGGTWGWGPVGYVNGTLLWPETLRHFLSVIPKESVGGP